MRYFGIEYRARPLTSIATPAPPAISPTIRKPIPTQSTTVVFAPTFTTALTCGAPVAFIATIVQSPPSTFQLVVTWPPPLAEAFQKRSRPGGPGRSSSGVPLVLHCAVVNVGPLAASHSGQVAIHGALRADSNEERLP